MREIKFRAFKKSVPSRGMYQVENIDFKKKSVNLKRNIGHSSWVPFHSIKLMQYTGLKDKNGKGIWEGDIVKRLITRLDIMGNHEWKARGQVSFNDGGFCMDFSEECSGTEHLYGSDNEVIGNIYENPELLKGG